MMKRRAQQIETKSTVNFDLYLTGQNLEAFTVTASVQAPVMREESVIVVANVCV